MDDVCPRVKFLLFIQRLEALGHVGHKDTQPKGDAHHLGAD